MANQQTQKPDNQKQGGSGNFANDRERAREAGQKGGVQSHRGSEGSSSQGQEGDSKNSGGAEDGVDEETSLESGADQSRSSGNFADDPERARTAGKKGGERSHGGR